MIKLESKARTVEISFDRRITSQIYRWHGRRARIRVRIKESEVSIMNVIKLSLP
jgi:hypothetical protein